MVSSLKRRALHRAFYIVGNSHELALRLRVSEASLLRWLAGKGELPTPVFHNVLELILDHPELTTA